MEMFLLILLSVCLLAVGLYHTNWGKILGITYFEEEYLLHKPLDGLYVSYLFEDLEYFLKKYCRKNLIYRNYRKQYYSICYKADVPLGGPWSSWNLVENMPDKSFVDYDIRFKSGWCITIYSKNTPLCTVYHDDQTVFYEDEEYSKVRLVGWPVVNFPWNKREILRRQQFLNEVVAVLRKIDPSKKF